MNWLYEYRWPILFVFVAIAEGSLIVWIIGGAIGEYK